jgi:lipoprotein NlpI
VRILLCTLVAAAVFSTVRADELSDKSSPCDYKVLAQDPASDLSSCDNQAVTAVATIEAKTYFAAHPTVTQAKSSDPWVIARALKHGLVTSVSKTLYAVTFAETITALGSKEPLDNSIATPSPTPTSTASNDSLDAIAAFNRGLAYRALGQYEKAINDFTEAIRLKPDYHFFDERGKAYYDLKQYDKAFSDYTEAIRLKPDYFLAFADRGLAYRALGQYEKAINDFTEVIRLYPDNERSFWERGHTYYLFKQYDKAISDYTDAIRLEPNNAESYDERADCYDKLGNAYAAERDRAKAKELRAKKPPSSMLRPKREIPSACFRFEPVPLAFERSVSACNAARLCGSMGLKGRLTMLLEPAPWG